VQSDETSNN